MKHVLIYSPSPHDGVSFYRQWGPMSALHREVRLTSFSNRIEEFTHWTWFLNYDVCLMSRPYKHSDFVFAEQCKKFGLPLWVDYDDALLHVTDDNPSFSTFASNDARKFCIDTLMLADVITVSSAVQKEFFEKKLTFKNIVLVPNALDDRLLRYARPFKMDKKVAWRGSSSHVRDLLSKSDQIVSAMNKLPDFEWGYWGLNPFFITDKVKNANWWRAEFTNLIDFIIEFTKFNPSFLFVPLADTFFNRVKSHLAWIDGTLAGAVCLCPEFEEWDKPGMVRWGEELTLENFLGFSEKFLKRQHEKSLEWQKDNILLSKVNNLRLEIINNL